MFAHALRAGGIGARVTAIVAVIAALAVAAWQSSFAISDDGSTFVASAVTYVPVGLIAGALLGLLLFGLIGFCVALLGVKRVGWTFTYTIFGAALFALAVHFLQPLIEGATEVFNIVAAVALSALVGAVSGVFVAGGLKDGPDI
jgi:uncharacterized membrane-anchored protein YitT (DUF2179 family)